MNDKKLAQSLKLLHKTLKAAKVSPKDEVIFAATSKAFEVAFEYAWKTLKREADLAGYETYNPRDAIRAAAQLGLVKDPELWYRFLNARNLSIHDYIGLEDKDYLSIMTLFAAEIERINS